MKSRALQSFAMPNLTLRSKPILIGLALSLWPMGFGSEAHQMLHHLPKTENAAFQDEIFGEQAKAYGLSNKVWRSDQFEISLLAPEAGPHQSEAEYKVRMDKGDALTFTWHVENLDDSEEFYFDFHGEALPESEQSKTAVTNYEKRIGLQKSGYLIAPFSGAHGWYFQNQSAKPVVVHLTISGFYELAYPGSFGNEGGLLPINPQRR